MTRARAIGWVASLALLAGAAGGCYRPTIVEGGLKCNLDAGGAPCPEGFSCDMTFSPPRCFKGPHDGGPNGDGPVMTDAVEVPPSPDADSGLPCLDARPACDPSDAGVCDPYCQSGCAGCRDRCTVSPAGAAVCKMVGTTTIGALKLCDSSSVATDNCAPGLVCMNDNCGGRCYQFCRTDADCPGASCSRTAPGGQPVCDVPYVDTCVPTPSSNGGQTGCSSGAQACYVSFSHPTRTVCDCTGGGMPSSPCAGSRDCLAGLLCVDPNGLGQQQCLPVCVLALSGADCTNGGTCHQYTGNSATNPANATYGYCF
jgi:hypothetical protein